MAKAVKAKVKFWEEKLHEWQISGLSRKEYCEKNVLKKAQQTTGLGNFLKKVKRKER